MVANARCIRSCDLKLNQNEFATGISRDDPASMPARGGD
jgi:hypothetical protein